MFKKNNQKFELVEVQQEESGIHNNVTHGEEYPIHELSKTGDVFVNVNDLKIATAICYPTGVRWVDQNVPPKILAKNTDFSAKPVLNEDFSYKNVLHADLFWETANPGKSRVNPGNKCLEFDLIANGKNNSFAFDLGKIISDKEWTLRFKVDLQNFSNPSGAQIQRCYFGVSSSDQNGIANSNQHFIGLIVQTDTHGVDDYRYAAIAVNNASLNNNPDGFFKYRPITGPIIIEIKRNSKEYTVSLISAVGYPSPIESLTTKCPESLTNLRYICGKNQTDLYAESTLKGVIEAVEFYNGATNNDLETSPRIKIGER